MSLWGGAYQHREALIMAAVTPGVWAGWASRPALTEAQEQHDFCKQHQGMVVFIYLVDDEVMLAISESRAVIPH